MSAHQDPRRAARTARFLSLFAWGFHNNDLSTLSDEERVELVEMQPQLEKIDAPILTLAPRRPIAEFNKVDLAILRQALYEILCTNTPARVVIDEAIELAKQYGSEETAGFVNGVLGTYLDTQKTL